MEIEHLVYDILTEEEKNMPLPNNGMGKEEATYIRITHKGKTIGLFSDAVEPEDATFSRDYNWIPDIILKAYQLGKGDKNDKI